MFLQISHATLAAIGANQSHQGAIGDLNVLLVHGRLFDGERNEIILNRTRVSSLDACREEITLAIANFSSAT